MASREVGDIPVEVLPVVPWKSRLDMLPNDSKSFVWTFLADVFACAVVSPYPVRLLVLYSGDGDPIHGTTSGDEFLAGVLIRFLSSITESMKCKPSLLQIQDR